MLKTINAICGLFALLMVCATVAVAWYQVEQIMRYWPVRGEYAVACGMVEDPASDICTDWEHRFSMVAAGALVPFLFGPFILVYLNTVRKPASVRGSLAVWTIIMLSMFTVFFSGIVIYALT